MYHVKYLNNISPKGTALWTEDYASTENLDEAEAVLVRSAAMHDLALPEKLLAVARAGAGVNNIPLAKCAEQGVVVFNTPGANANGVMELALCGMLLGCRDIVGGIEWVKSIRGEGDVAKKVEKGKSKFAGHEIAHKSLGVIGPIIFDYRKEKNPCSMCSKMRRGALNQAILEDDCHILALGHHYDDAVETFLMSLLFEGRISCFQPVTELTQTGITQIRPMLYIHERTIDHFAVQEGLPVLKNRCPADKNTKREEVKQLIYSLSQTYPDLKERIFGAMQRQPLPGWEPLGRYKRPKDDTLE